MHYACMYHNEYNRFISFPHSPYKLKSWGKRAKGTEAPQRSNRSQGYNKDPDLLIISLARELQQASLNEKLIEILTILFLGTSINRSWDKEKRFAAFLLFGEGYTDFAEYEKAASFLRKALAITNDPENKVTALCQMGKMSRPAIQ